jgi:uncharacterized protein with PQ loop repeat
MFSWLMLSGWVLAGVSVSSELLQVFRASRAGRTDGVSPHTVVGTLVVFAWWLCYSTRLGVWPGVATDAVTLVLAYMHARSVRALRTAHWLFLIPAVLYGSLVPITVLGLSGTAGSMLRGGPQLVRTLRRGDAQGVSWEYWALQAATGLGWLAYGVFVGAMWLGAFAVVSAPVGVFIAWRVFKAGRGAVAVEEVFSSTLEPAN